MDLASRVGITAGALALLVGAPATGAAPAQAQVPTAPPTCDAPEHRAFDFWVGAWDVRDASGRVVAENVITLEMNDCVLHESYTNAQGYHGESFSLYDRSRGVWHQTWVDQNGALLRIEGGLVGGSMVLEGPTTRLDGTEVLNRITWTPNADGTVRQHWQTTSDGGETWGTVFDGTYERR